MIYNMNDEKEVWYVNENDEILTGTFYDYDYKDGVRVGLVYLDPWDYIDEIKAIPVEMLFESELSAMRYLLDKVIKDVKLLKSNVK